MIAELRGRGLWDDSLVVVVAALYSAGRVRFDYVSSVEMNHKVKRDGTVMIHPNYMAWRGQLEQAVRTAARKG